MEANALKLKNKHVSSNLAFNNDWRSLHPANHSHWPHRDLASVHGHVPLLRRCNKGLSKPNHQISASPEKGIHGSTTGKQNKKQTPNETKLTQTFRLNNTNCENVSSGLVVKQSIKQGKNQQTYWQDTPYRNQFKRLQHVIVCFWSRYNLKRYQKH